ncbi:hypothetical protein RUM43_000591 [Polyplax serrata]|uniref:Peroxidase n=1 Tax=Polyplax serrata TaxID=468196 RepID=A0AAN8SDJ9_POLSC
MKRIRNVFEKCFLIHVLILCTLSLDNNNLVNASEGVEPHITDHDLNIAVKVAEEIISKWQRLENNLVDSGIRVKENTPSHGQLINSYPSPEALDYGKNALIANRASLYLIQKHCQRSNIRLSDCLRAITNKSLSATPLGEKCTSQFGISNCTGSQYYRTFDGSCNNVANQILGKSLTAYRRLLPSQYFNGVNEPRKSVSRKPLPSPRLISNVLIHDSDKQEKATTLAFVQWTQFIANDLFHTPTSKMIHVGSSIECCNENGKNLSPRYVHPTCQPINIPTDDPDYSTQRTVCMNYVRSINSLRKECTFGSAEQMNQATHFLDGSMIYGSTAEAVYLLRTMEKGKLITTNINKVELLPFSETPENSCQLDDDKICFRSGDSRVNLHPHHTVMYTVWVREHNRIAEILSRVNPHWSDDTIFEETRRIVIAEIQHITYKHWIPQVLGYEITEKSNLDIKAKGFSNAYSEDVDPSISNSFATVGLTFINSMFQSQLRLYDDGGIHNNTILLKDYFNKPSILQEPKIFEQLLRGLSYETSQKMDASFVKDVTNFLFRGSSPMGQDVISLDIQRGRDHGIPGYNAFRKFCNMSATDKFETFSDSVSQVNINKLRSLYSHTDDVDLIAGAISESPKFGSAVGPVFQCIIKEQMSRTRMGDKYFYDNGGKFSSFKEGQLNEIKKITLARIFCDNVKEIKRMQVDLFNVPSPKNPLVDCQDASAVPVLNLNLWRANT